MVCWYVVLIDKHINENTWIQIETNNRVVYEKWWHNNEVQNNHSYTIKDKVVFG